MKEIGALLKKAREELGKTLDEIANDTKIRKKYLQGLEEGDFDIIPGGEVYIKGFIKSYAVCVGLDGDELIEKYKEFKKTFEGKEGILENETDELHLSKPVKQKIETETKNNSKFILFLLSVFIVITAVFLVSKIKPTPETKPSNEINLQDQADQDKNGNTILGEEDEPENKLNQETKPILNKINETQREVHYTINQNPELELKVKTESCWIRIEVDNSKVAEETLYEGNERQWSGNEKIYILAGNPKAIELTLNGIEINTSYIKPYNFIFEKKE